MTESGIKDVLVFLGLTNRRFLLQLLFNFLTLLFIILVLFAIFIINFRFVVGPIPILLFLTAAMLFYFLMRSKFIFKQKWMLFLGFSRYLANNQDTLPDGRAEKRFSTLLALKDIRIRLREVKLELNKSGQKWVSEDIALALAVGLSGSLIQQMEKSHVSPHTLTRDSIRYFVVKFLIFISCLIPFAIISFLFTIGIQPGLTYLVYALGFLFAYFLYVAIFDPIVSLFIHRKISQRLKPN